MSAPIYVYYTFLKIHCIINIPLKVYTGSEISMICEISSGIFN